MVLSIPFPLLFNMDEEWVLRYNWDIANVWFTLLKNYSKWVYGKNPNHKILLWGLNDFKPTNQPKIWKSSRKLARTQEKIK